MFSGRRLFALLVSVVVLILLAGVTLGNAGRIANWPEQVVMNTESTVSGWIYQPVSKMASFFAGIRTLREVYRQNALLKNELQNYESLRAQLNDKEVQIAQLQNMLGYKNSAPSQLKLLPAAVTGRDPSTWNSELTIGEGTSAGVQPNMAVVAPDGSLVGRVAVVASNSAKVVLITDTRLGDGVSALVQNGSLHEPFGIVVGSVRLAGKLQMSFWAPLIQVQVGQEVVTSGLSDIYPKGIVIGTIQAVQDGPQGSVTSAIVTPAANLNYLQNVFVVESKPGATAK